MKIEVLNAGHEYIVLVDGHESRLRVNGPLVVGEVFWKENGKKRHFTLKAFPISMVDVLQRRIEIEIAKKHR